MENFILNVVSVVAVVLIYKYLIKVSILEEYRQDLFELRRKLFSLYFIDKVEIRESDYRFLEKLVNANIRFAHRSNLISFLYLQKTVLSKDGLEKVPVHIEFIKTVKYLEENNKTEYIALIKDVNELSGSYLLKSSPFLTLLIFLWIGLSSLGSISIIKIISSLGSISLTKTVSKKFNKSVSESNLISDLAYQS